MGKTVWGGIRIGWIRAERPLIQRLARARSAGDLGTPILEQLIAARLLGRYDDILASRRAQLLAGRDHLTAALRGHFPEWQVPDVDGGLTLWVNLGAPVSSQLTIAARSRGPAHRGRAPVRPGRRIRAVPAHPVQLPAG